MSAAVVPPHVAVPDPFHLVSGDGPVVAVAIHDGHDVRPEVGELLALPEEARLREEDPFTGGWTQVAPTRIVVHRSRFEVDLNRPRESAVYRRPEDAWGLRVWRTPLSDAVVARSLEVYDQFYAVVRRELDRLAEAYGRFVVLDLHSFNYRRAGPRAPVDVARHPDVNLGTASLDRARWAPVVDRVLAELGAGQVLERPLEVGENVIFGGGAFSRWVHATYPESGCALALEFKKIFMDEWTAELDAEIHQRILALLRGVSAGVSEELGRMAGALRRSGIRGEGEST